jgi:hypothetical protein
MVVHYTGFVSLVRNNHASATRDHDGSALSRRLDNPIIEPVSGSDDDPTSPTYIPGECEEVEGSIDDDDYFPGTTAIRPGDYTPGTGQVIPEKFTPPNPSIRPHILFPPRR